jgi:ATP adenylyltransferase
VDPTDPGLGGAALQAPWRLGYIEGLPKEGAPGGRSTDGCFLREYWLDPAGDEKNHVVARTSTGLIMLNAYPYASGHLLAALGEGRARLLDYTPEQRATLWRLTDIAAALMERTLEPQGINIGINQGRAAGAGVPQHLHVHLVPRWGGDVNFMTVVSRVRVLPGSLEAMARRYRDVWKEMRAQWE